MKFYNSIGPNPRVVKMFMQEKGITIPFVEVDLMAGENRKEPYVAKNPGGQLPALELDDGAVLTEITNICEYLEEKNPSTTPLFGSTPEELGKHVTAELAKWKPVVEGANIQMD